MVKIPQDFREFFALLNEEKAEYLVVGGYAVSVYGHPRYTGDIDVWVGQGAGNAERIVRAVKRFGFDVPELTSRSFSDHNRITQMGVEPLRIEIFTFIPGVDFESSYERRNVVIFEGVPIPFIGLEDLKKSKGATKRAKDQADLENLP